jgi:hypothetical protein
MQVERSELIEALREVFEIAEDGISATPSDEDDLIESAVAAVQALRDAFDDCQDELSNDIE